MRFKQIIKYTLSPRGKDEFIRQIPYGEKVLDVGCGNDSPYVTKTQRPDLYYIGIDVGEYRQWHDPAQYADRYIVTSPDGFVPEIDSLHGQMDAVICSHTLEHRDDPDRTLWAILNALKPGGRLYLSFPCPESATFPSRYGCLNFYDDPSHTTPPPFEKVVAQIAAAGVVINYSRRQYRPLMGVLLGLLQEPFSAYRRKAMRGTWALYGFETVIWATKG